MKPFSYYDLLDAFTLSGCPVCRLLSLDAQRFLDSLLYENTMDIGIQQGMRASRGLCNTHAWQLLEYKGNAAGIAVLSEAVLDELISLLRSDGSPAASARSLRGLISKRDGTQTAAALDARQGCLCCGLLDRTEANYLQTIADHFAEGPMQEAFRVSEGLCLPHFRQFVPLLRDPALLRTAIEAQANIWQHLKDELEQYLRQSGARATDEPMGAEGDSWQRAILAIAGDRRLFGMDGSRKKR
ncbi:MAG: hypothetical protein KJ065_05185 [Anaerolineae bacterium]|nr:hypothetical protein [Anaerolineae bacterium]